MRRPFKDGTLIVNDLAAHSPAPTGTLVRSSAYTEENRRKYLRDGYIHIENGLNDDVPDQLLSDLEHKTYLKVESPAGRRGVTTFYSKNGANLLAASPMIPSLEKELIELTNWLSGITYEALDNRSIGASVNITPAGGGFGTHFDRQEVSVIAYLNKVEGGELDLWARLRRWEPGWLGAFAHRVTMLLTTLLRPVRIAPKRGSILIFTKLTPHRVAEVKSDQKRVSVVFGLDRPGVSFLQNQTYYGDAEENVPIGALRQG